VINLTQPVDAILWEALASRSMLDPSSGCRVWCRAKSKGYGRLWWNNKVEYAPRLAWQAWFGCVPPGKSVCHRCDNPPCIEPTHLFVGTQADNMHDCAAKGRTLPQKRRINFTVGENHHSSKLTQDEVLEIIRRRHAGETYVQIATAYNVTRHQVSCICRGLSWCHVQHPFPVEAERILRTKLSDTDVLEIRTRRAAGSTLDELSYAFGISSNYVWHLCKRHYRNGQYQYRPSIMSGGGT
jgi:hypothetical protein